MYTGVVAATASNDIPLSFFLYLYVLYSITFYQNFLPTYIYAFSVNDQSADESYKFCNKR